MGVYDPGTVVANILGVQLFGFAKGTFIKAERSEKVWKQEVGAQGEVTDIRSRNRTGKITFTLLAESPCNDLLSVLLKSDELAGITFGPCWINDMLGTTLVRSASCRIEGWPTVEYSDEATKREWVVICSALDEYVGGTFNITG